MRSLKVLRVARACSMRVVTRARAAAFEARARARTRQARALARAAEGGLAEVAGGDLAVAVSVEQGLSTTVRQGEVETVEFNRDQGFGITLYVGQRKASARLQTCTPPLPPNAIKGNPAGSRPRSDETALSARIIRALAIR